MASFINEYTILFKSVEKHILNKETIIAELTYRVTCLQEAHHKLLSKNENLKYSVQSRSGNWDKHLLVLPGPGTRKPLISYPGTAETLPWRFVRPSGLVVSEILGNWNFHTTTSRTAFIQLRL